jgi:enoyl-CoA hydratase/carnithine racemase
MKTTSCPPPCEEALFTAEFPEPGIALVRIKRQHTAHLSLFDDKVPYLRFLDRFTSDQTIKCIIILGHPEKRGDGEFREWRDEVTSDPHALDRVRQVVMALQQCVLRIVQLPQITIYGDAGRITPNYLSVALAADYFFAADSTLLQNPNASCDFLPAGGAAYLLRQRLPRPRALDFLTSANELDAKAMQALGICDGVFPSADFEEELLAKARSLAQHETSYLRAIKTAHRPASESLEAWFQHELKVIQRGARVVG